MSILCYMSAVTTLLVGYNCLTGFSNPDKHLETSPNLLAVILLAGCQIVKVLRALIAQLFLGISVKFQGCLFFITKVG